MGLGVFISRFGFGQLAGFIIDVIVPLGRAVDAIGPVYAGVEPLRRIGRGHLVGQHVAHFIVEAPGILLAGKIAALPAPIGPGAGQPVEHLLDAGLMDITLILRQFFQRLLVLGMAPQEFRDAFLFDRFQRRRDARLAEIFLGHDVDRHLAPLLRRFNVTHIENDLAVRVADQA